MAKGTEKEEQAPTIEYLNKKVEILHKYNDELWDLFGQVLDYLNEMSGERRGQYLMVIKEIYESKLAERYNTKQLNEHFESHYHSDKKRNTTRYIIKE